MTKLAIVRALDPTCIHLPAELRRYCPDCHAGQRHYRAEVDELALEAGLPTVANGRAWHATAVSWATARTLRRSGVVPQITLPEFCVVRSRGSYRSSNQPCSSLRLT